jgi:hypothetical protein
MKKLPFRTCFLISLFLFGKVAPVLLGANVNDNTLPSATASTYAMADSASQSSSAVLSDSQAQYSIGPTTLELASASTDFTEYGGLGFSPAFGAKADVQIFPYQAGVASSGQAYGDLTYNISLIGPGTQPISVDYDTEGIAQLTLNPGSSVTGAVITAAVYTTIPGFGGNQGNHLSTGLNVNGTNQSQTNEFTVSNGQLLLTPGEAYQIALNASVVLSGEPETSTQYTISQPIEGYAFVDPMFSVDSSVPNASRYQFEISPNLSIPESNTATLLLAGFALLCVLRLVRSGKGDSHGAT